MKTSSFQHFRQGHFAFLGQRAFAGFEHGDDFHFLLDRHTFLLAADQLEKTVEQIPVEVGEIGRQGPPALGAVEVNLGAG